MRFDGIHDGRLKEVLTDTDVVCRELTNELNEEQIILLFKGILYLFTDYFVIT